MEAAPATRVVPLEPRDVLRAAFALYRWQARKLCAIVALVLIPVEVVVAVIVRESISSGQPFALNGGIYTNSSTTVANTCPYVAAYLAAIVTTALLSKCVVDAYTGHPSSWRGSLKYGARRLGPLLWLTLIASLLLLIGYTFAILPGVYLTVAWIVAVPVVMFEQVDGFEALSRSRDLVSGRWWTTFGTLVAGGLAIGVLTVIVNLVFLAIDSANNITVVLILSSIGRVIEAMIAYPLWAAITVILYIDLRGRKEHFDAHALT
jgi:hypothetical protein